jgi:hypothetical protein
LIGYGIGQIKHKATYLFPLFGQKQEAIVTFKFIAIAYKLRRVQENLPSTKIISTTTHLLIA